MILEDIISMAVIYKIWSEKGDKVYIGSTTRPLEKRWSQHISDINKTKSKILFDEYGKDYCKIEEIEKVDISGRVSRERYWIETYDATVINKILPGQKRPEWYEKNKDCLREYRKDWYEKNKAVIIDKVKQKSYIETLCECGLVIRQGYLSVHKTTKKHQNLLNQVRLSLSVEALVEEN